MSRRWWFPFDEWRRWLSSTADGGSSARPILADRPAALLSAERLHKFEIVACLRRMWRLLSAVCWR